VSRAYQMYIGGQWLDAIDGKAFNDYNPYSGEVYATLPAGKRGDARKACDAAAAAFLDWSHTPPAERQGYFLRAADILEGRQQEIISIITQETGGTLGWGMFQTGFVPGLLREAAAQVHAINGEIIPADLPGAFFIAIRQPVGVVAGIAPWNAPLILSLRAVALPMACGNTTVLKPSAEAPVSGGVILAEVFEEAGLPRGVFNVITNGPGFSGEVGDEFIEHPKVLRLSFTGSTEVGRQIAEKAARHLKKVTLELGGNDPLIILKDADIDYAVDAATFGRFNYQGQVCMASKRIIVEKPVATDFTEKFVQKAQRLKVGDPQDPDTVIGPLINQKQVDMLHKQVQEAIKQGARLVCGGKYEGRCYYPTVLTDVSPNMNIAREETFGPVAPIIIVEDADEAVRVANDSRFGLSAGVITGDFQKALDIAERLETGMVHINDSTIHDEPQVPFGGMKESGYGRHGGRAAIEEFTELRWISIQRTPRQYPF
jgi:acyl-CoA reductase-like NAD-dependent aldehyde dehydrogenase